MRLFSALQENKKELQDKLDSHSLLSGLVKILLAANKGLGSVVAALKQSSNVQQHTEQMASASEEMLASANNMAETTASVSHNASQSLTKALNASEQSTKAAQVMEEIVKIVNSASEGMTQLENDSKQINSILNQIENIAEQTHMLALNATIESARAGEAGKGFAVVAKEVKDLASQAEKASDLIRQRLDGLRQDISNSAAIIKKVADIVQTGQTVIESATSSAYEIAEIYRSVTADITTIASTVEEQRSVAENLTSRTHEVAKMALANTSELYNILDTMDGTDSTIVKEMGQFSNLTDGYAVTQRAKSDHIIFQRNVFLSIVGKGKMKSSEVPDCHGCRFGKWYDAVTDTTIINDPVFKEILPLHHDFHNISRQAISLAEQKELEEALDKFESIKDLSLKIISKLDQLSEKLKK